MGYPAKILTLASNLLSGNRMKVEDGDSAFEEGRQFRIGYEFDLSDTSGRRVIQITFGNNIVLTKSSLEVDQGGVRYSVVGGATATGTFNATIPSLRKNNMDGAPQLTSQTIFKTGGDFTGGTDFPIARVRTGSGNNARASSINTAAQNRGFGTNTLFIVLEDLNGVNDDSLGLLNLEWDEIF